MDLPDQEGAAGIQQTTPFRTDAIEQKYVELSDQHHF